MTTTRINHTGHNHPSTTKARQACRKLVAGAVVGDMIQAPFTPGWGVVLQVNHMTGELKTRYSDTITLYVPASTVTMIERRPR